MWISKNSTYYDSSSVSIFNSDNNNYSNSNNSNNIYELLSLFLFFNNFLIKQASLIVCASHKLYALYLSILVLSSFVVVLFIVNFNVVYQYIHYRYDYVSIFHDTNLFFSCIFTTVIIIIGFITGIIKFTSIQCHTIGIFTIIVLIHTLIIDTTITTLQALQYVVALAVPLFVPIF